MGTRSFPFISVSPLSVLKGVRTKTWTLPNLLTSGKGPDPQPPARRVLRPSTMS